MDGLSWRKLKAQLEYHIPVIIFTGRIRWKTRSRPNKGGDDYLTKPLKPMS
jgi:DNA-binding response OmpR family regulator